jgi:nitrogen-specific signal transduction histidine kinase
VTAFFPEFTRAVAEPGREEKIWEVRRRDGHSVPCLVELELAKVPVWDTESAPLSAAEAEMYLMVFHDMTGILRDEKEQRARSSLDAAAGVINEMAHEVRNPLTAIKSAGELLSHTADAVAKQRQAVSREDWDVINSMCTVISEETSRLDQKVQFFVERVAREPSRLETLVDNASYWLKRTSANGGRGDEQNPSGR